MREIKFRGKRLDNGEWVYGDYHHRAGGVHCIIDMQPNFQGKVEYVVIQVDTETIGQFTGLRDKNNKEIYEGDIVLSKLKRARKYDEILQICFDDSEYCGKNKHGSSTSLSLLGDYHTVEVIGNIHDKPELLNE